MNNKLRDAILQTGLTSESLRDAIRAKPSDEVIVSLEVLRALGIAPGDLASEFDRDFVIDESSVWRADQTIHPGVFVRGAAVILSPRGV